MTVHDLYNINPRAVWPGLLSLELIVGGAAAMWFFLPEHGVWTVRIIRGAVALLLLLAAVQCRFALLYLFYPLYLDFAEPQTAAVSWLVWHGHSLYPPLATGDLYAPVFGPILYQLNGAALLLLGPSIFASKLPGVLAFAAAEGLVFLCRAERRASVAGADDHRRAVRGAGGVRTASFRLRGTRRSLAVPAGGGCYPGGHPAADPYRRGGAGCAGRACR